MRLNEYITLGRSGLRVSPLCLGTMTFGTEWGWGSEENVSRSVFDGYIDAGGNFVDTADGYTGGKSEELVGKFIADRKLRDRVVLATKFTFNTEPGNPNAGGNGRKNVYRALEGSLRRLRTDYIDLYWLHAWDTVTPVEEVVATLNDLVREGKIRHYGLSDTPAWYVARAYTLAEKEGKERPIALQLEYSLVERNIEREHIPVAQELGLGICPWSPLASGFLTGKYKRQGEDGSGDGRLEKTKDSGNPTLMRFNRSELESPRRASRSRQGNRPATRARGSQLGCHSAGHLVDHHRRQQVGSAQRQSELDRVHHSRRTPPPSRRSGRTGFNPSLHVLRVVHSGHDQRRNGDRRLEAGARVSADPELLNRSPPHRQNGRPVSSHAH